MAECGFTALSFSASHKQGTWGIQDSSGLDAVHKCVSTISCPGANAVPLEKLTLRPLPPRSLVL